MAGEDLACRMNILLSHANHGMERERSNSDRRTQRQRQRYQRTIWSEAKNGAIHINRST